MKEQSREIHLGPDFKLPVPLFGQIGINFSPEEDKTIIKYLLTEEASRPPDLILPPFSLMIYRHGIAAQSMMDNIGVQIDEKHQLFPGTAVSLEDRQSEHIHGPSHLVLLGNMPLARLDHEGLSQVVLTQCGQVSFETHIVTPGKPVLVEAVPDLSVLLSVNRIESEKLNLLMGGLKLVGDTTKIDYTNTYYGGQKGPWYSQDPENISDRFSLCPVGPNGRSFRAVQVSGSFLTLGQGDNRIFTVWVQAGRQTEGDDATPYYVIKYVGNPQEPETSLVEEEL